MIYLLLILILYLRQYKYARLIDDPVPRDGYLYEMPRKVGHEWYDEGRGRVSTAVNVLVFCAVCGYIDYLYGWKAAVMYAVFPLNVCGVAWITGNYYMSTVLLCLASLTFIKYWWLSALFYAAALNSTLISISFFLILCMNPLGWVSLWPLVAFLRGKRLKTGLRQRKDNHDDMGLKGGFRVENLWNIPRVMAYYVYLTIWPNKLGFFHTFGKLDRHQSWGWWWLSLLIVSLFALWMGLVDWKMGVWWFISIGVFSQFIILGQFVTERYTPLANVAWCVILSQFLPYDLFLVVCTLYFCRSLAYIPAWKSNARLFGYGTVQFPECGENWVNYASYYIDRKDTFSAIKPLLVAEKLVKGDKYGVYCDLANCYGQNGFYNKALEWTNKALEVATKDKIRGMMEQRDDIERKIYKMQRGNRALKEMGVIS